MEYGILASKDVVEKTMEAMKARGIATEFVQTKEEALEMLKNLIPQGSEVMTASSTTLDQIGFVDMLKSGNHPWKNLKDEIVAQKDQARQNELRRQSILAGYFIGSVHAVAETGEAVTASATGSQIPSYVFSSDHVIWVIGAQKIVPTLQDALTRVRDYVFPLEDKRMKAAGYPGSVIGKMIIFEKETSPERKITAVFVNEILGF